MSEDKKIRRGNLYSYIKTTDQFLQERELFNKFLKILPDIWDFEPSHLYIVSTEERNDDLVQLLIDLKIIEYDWNEILKQTHRTIGNRIIEFRLNGSKFWKLYNRVSGKNGIIKKQALELISKDISERFSLDKIVELFADLGVPKSIFILDTKWRAVFYVLSYYATSKLVKDQIQLIKIIQEFIHPLSVNGDEEKAKELQEKYKRWLKYDPSIKIHKDGKVYLGPTEEEWELGIHDYVDTDGNTVNVLEISDHWSVFDMAKLWLFWNLIFIIVNAYHSNQALNKKELEDLYLVLVDKVENLISDKSVGKKITEIYERPFISLSTAEIEAKAKGAENASSLLSSFLVEIKNYRLRFSDVKSVVKQNQELINRINSAIKATNIEDANFLKTAEQNLLRVEIAKIPTLKIKGETSKSVKQKGAISLKGRKVSYDESKSTIFVDNKACPLPPAKNEDYLARAMFKRLIDEPVDWSIIYEEMSGDEAKNSEINRKSVRDTMDRLNKRVKKIIGTNDELLTWENKTLKRKF